MLKGNEQLDLFGNLVADTPTIDREALGGALAKLFIGMSLDDIVRMFTCEYNEIVEYIGLSQGEERCKKTSLLFNPHRMEIASYGGENKTERRQSAFVALRESPDFHSGLARMTMYAKKKEIPDALHWMLVLGVNGTGCVSEFPPWGARELCMRYKLHANSRVLDPCAGWGGRMLGVSVVCHHYTCYEPSTRTASGLVKLSDFIRSINTPFEADVICQPYEDTEETPNHYDLAFTSPPYYDTEEYSDEITNSCNRYPSFNEWVEGFYKPLIDKTIRQLKPGAAFVINVGDRKYPLSKILESHCVDMGYNWRRVKGPVVNSAGFGKEKDKGEKFWEITGRG